MNKIAILVGSLRKDSFNRKLANALSKCAPSSLTLEIIDISTLPIYNQDLDSNPPAEWVQFRKKMQDFKGVIFVTPEYNRSVPAVLKNAIDVGSRPYGQSIWDGKPGAVASASPGTIGGFGANHHLRQSMVFLNVPCMQQPELYLSRVDTLMDANGNVTNEDVKKLLQKFMDRYATWVDANT